MVSHLTKFRRTVQEPVSKTPCHTPEKTSGPCEGAFVATEESRNSGVETLRGVYPEPVEGLRVTFLR